MYTLRQCKLSHMPESVCIPLSLSLSSLSLSLSLSFSLSLYLSLSISLSLSNSHKHTHTSRGEQLRSGLLLPASCCLTSALLRVIAVGNGVGPVGLGHNG